MEILSYTQLLSELQLQGQSGEGKRKKASLILLQNGLTEEKISILSLNEASKSKALQNGTLKCL